MNKLCKLLLTLVVVLTLTACTTNNVNNNNQNIDTGTDNKDETVNKTSIKYVKMLEIEDQTYTGKEIKPTQELKDKDKALIEGVDYTLSYSNNINVGTASLTITGIGNYEGSVIINFKIVESKKEQNTSNGTTNINKDPINKIDLSEAAIHGCTEYEYTGKEIKPIPTVVLNGKTLVKGTDYTVTYFDNINPGTAKLTITGIGKYTGTAIDRFTILEKEDESLNVTLTSITLNQTTTYHGIKGYFTKDKNIMNVDLVKYGIAEDNNKAILFFTEYYDKDTNEKILFACYNVPEAKFMGYVNKAGGIGFVAIEVN